MPPTAAIVTILWPIAVGFGALFALARYSDSIARRVAPEMLTRHSRPSRPDMPKTFLGWLQFTASRIAAIAGVFAYLAGPIALQFAVVALIVIFFARDAYKRTKPLVVRGATAKETIVLTLLSTIWVLSWTYFIFRFTYHRHVAG